MNPCHRLSSIVRIPVYPLCVCACVHACVHVCVHVCVCVVIVAVSVCSSARAYVRLYVCVRLFGLRNMKPHVVIQQRLI